MKSTAEILIDSLQSLAELKEKIIVTSRAERFTLLRFQVRPNLFSLNQFQKRETDCSSLFHCAICE